MTDQLQAWNNYILLCGGILFVTWMLSAYIGLAVIWYKDKKNGRR